MDVCGHNESDVELNLRTLREKQRIEMYEVEKCSGMHPLVGGLPKELRLP